MVALFTTLEFDTLSENDILEAARLQLENTSSVSLTFKWTANSKIVFFMLHCRVKDAEWFDVLKGSAVKDDDGNETFNLGNYTGGTEIEIRFGIFAVTSVAKAIAIISQNNPEHAELASPKGTLTPKQIAQGEKWEDTIKYKIHAKQTA